MMNRKFSLDEMISKLKSHFETNEHQQEMMQRCKSISLAKILPEYPFKSIAQRFDTTIEQLQKIQLHSLQRFQGNISLRDMLTNAIFNTRECAYACYKPSAIFEQLCADIRA